MPVEASEARPHRAAAPTIFPTLRGFTVAWLSADLIAGIMLAAIALPEQIATARLAGMPVQTGLYAFAAGSLAFALFGKNRYASVGADSTIAPIFASAVALFAAAGSAPYVALAGLVALFAGIGLLIARAARAGWIADLLSIPVTTGFLAGIAVHIVVGQLPLVLGVPAGSGTLLANLVTLVREAPHANAATCALGAGVFALTLAGERIGPRFPGALLGLIGAGLAVMEFQLKGRGVALLGALPSALPHVGLGFVDPREALRLVPAAAIVAVVCMVQIAVVLRSFPSEDDGPDGPSDAFAAVGIGSIASALLGAFPVNASPPRTAIVASSGGRSQLSSVVAVVAVGAIVAFGGGLAAYLPLAALGGVLLFVGTRLVRVRDMASIARKGGREIGLVAAGALLVIVLPIDTGMLLAIVLSLASGIYTIARPPCGEFVRVPGTTIWWPPPDGEPQETLAGVLVFAPAAPIAFTNAQFIVRRLRALLAAAPHPVRVLVIECGGVIDVDYTGASIVSATIAQLRSGGIDVAIARLEDVRARAAAERTGLLAALGPKREFRSVQEALNALTPARTP